MRGEGDFKLWENMNLDGDHDDLFAGTSLHSPNINLSQESPARYVCSDIAQKIGGTLLSYPS
jgi:hypothetical protein